MCALREKLGGDPLHTGEVESSLDGWMVNSRRCLAWEPGCGSGVRRGGEVRRGFLLGTGLQAVRTQCVTDVVVRVREVGVRDRAPPNIPPDAVTLCQPLLTCTLSLLPPPHPQLSPYPSLTWLGGWGRQRKGYVPFVALHP